MPEEGWVPIANAAARNHRLSWRARGLLLELLSYPDGWDTTVDKLVALARDERKNGGNAEGRDAMQAAMNELVQAGYACHVRERGRRGQWTTTLVVSDSPGAIRRPTENPESANQESEDQESANQESDFQEVIKKTDSKTNIKTEDQTLHDEHSESLASLAVAAEAATRAEAIERSLQRIYAVVDKLEPDLRRRHLLAVERRRPKIYRQCRNEAIKQMENLDPDELRGDRAAHVIDLLSYKWMAKHYAPNWPQWFKRPLDEAYQQLTPTRREGKR